MSVAETSLVSEELNHIASNCDKPLRSVITYAVRGGKRLRAQLMLHAAEGFALHEQLLLRAAALVELLHAATLLQDDLFDGSHTRRGRPAAWVCFTPQLATLAADWMLAETMRLAFQLGGLPGEAFARCAQRLIVGEARESQLTGPRTLAALRRHALAVAHAKSGELFGLALSVPALLAGEAGLSMKFSAAGCSLGVAFQFFDDVFDLVGDAGTALKDVGRDARMNLATMPMLELWPALSASARDALLYGSQSFECLISDCADIDTREKLFRLAVERWRSAVEELKSFVAPTHSLPRYLEEMRDALTYSNAGRRDCSESAA